ncbi:MAG: glycosyltransferase [Lachnospiraceae bacterium]|nr:glycosyltransferase [Lachnospiraceae bacterium]
MDDSKLKVSIIVPVYNAEEFLPKCMESLVQQTEQEIEIICVDDGSTDKSNEILSEYSRQHSNVILLSQKNSGAAAARNYGIQQAQGEYLLFLDADDYFEKDLVQTAYGTAKDRDLDLLIFQASEFYHNTGMEKLTNRFINSKFLPKATVFSAKDVPDGIFNIASPCPWTKLFRRNFILENNITFQNLQRANDVYFVYTAMAKAERISTIQNPLVHYRIDNKGSLQANNSLSPLLFFEAFQAVKKELILSGTYEIFEKSFINVSSHHCIYTLHSLKNIEAFRQLYDALQNKILEEFSIKGKDEAYFYNKVDYKNLKRISEIPYEEYLFLRVSDVKNAYTAYKEKNPKQSEIKKELKQVKKELEQSQKELAQQQKKYEENNKGKLYQLARKVKKMVTVQ